MELAWKVVASSGLAEFRVTKGWAQFLGHGAFRDAGLCTVGRELWVFRYVNLVFKYYSRLVTRPLVTPEAQTA